MLFFESFLLLFSIAVLLIIGFYSFLYRHTQGSWSLCLLMAAAVIWTIGSLFERLYNTPEVMLFWRNIQQLGVFSVSYMTLVFAVRYTKNEKIQPYLPYISIFPVTTLFLIFTNEWHGLVRHGYQVIHHDLFHEVLLVESTWLGSLLVAVNFIIPIFSIGIFIWYRKSLAQEHKKRINLIILSFLLVFVSTFLKIAVLTDIGFHISISTLYLPGALLLLYSLMKYDFFHLVPIAKESVFHMVEQGILIIDAANTVVDVNLYAQKLLKNRDVQIAITGRSVPSIIEQEPTLEPILTVQNGQREVTWQQNGQSRYWQVTGHLLSKSGVERVGVAIFINDITERKRNELEMKKYAEMDSLTSLYNRRAFLSYYNQKVSKAHEQEQPVSFLLLDLDNFKRINDRYGHPVGDRVLQHFSDCLREFSKQEDLIGRLGGEEFGLLLIDADAQQAYRTAEIIRTSLSNRPIKTESAPPLHYTVSIGIDTVDAQNPSFKAVFHHADVALYEAKRRSKNQTVQYDPSME